MIQIIITPAQSNIENHSNNEMSLATTKIGLCTQTPTRNGGGAGIWCASRCWPWHRRRRRAADAAPHPAPDTDAPQPTPRPPLAPRPPFAFRPAQCGARRPRAEGRCRPSGGRPGGFLLLWGLCLSVLQESSRVLTHAKAGSPDPGSVSEPPNICPVHGIDSSCPGPVWVAFYQEIQLLDKEL